jgi:hypothetical protein
MRISYSDRMAALAMSAAALVELTNDETMDAVANELIQGALADIRTAASRLSQRIEVMA